MPNLQQPFEIEIDVLDYFISTILTQHGNLISYHSETSSDVVIRYPTYDKDIYSIVKVCQQWKNCIIGKETIIHTDHRPMEFM
jgi:hypothetical protein